MSGRSDDEAGLPEKVTDALGRETEFDYDGRGNLVMRRDPLDRVVSAEAGIDLHVVKPVDLDELGARLRALVRREGDVRTAELFLQIAQARQQCLARGHRKDALRRHPQRLDRIAALLRHLRLDLAGIQVLEALKPRAHRRCHGRVIHRRGPLVRPMGLHRLRRHDGVRGAAAGELRPKLQDPRDQHRAGHCQTLQTCHCNPPRTAFVVFVQ